METNTPGPTYETDLLAPYARAAEANSRIWSAIGILAAALVASFHFESPIVRGGAIGLYLIGVVAVVVVAARMGGVQPRFSGMPGPLKRNLYSFWAGSTVLALAVLAIGFAVNFIVAAVVVGVSVTLLGAWYQRRSRLIVAELARRAGDVRA